MVKFLNSDGLSRLVTLIKQALSNKQDSRLVVTYVGNNDASSTYGDILGAINAGNEVIVKYGYKDYQYCYNDSGWLYFIAVVGGYYYELRVNDEDKWNSDSFQLQSSLISGTNIKTIQLESLLGNGNIDINAGNVSTIQDDPNNKWIDGDSVEDALENLSLAIDSKQPTLISGTNIKTVNNTSLLGSGNISIEPNEIASITTTESTASGGNNTVTIAETNGTSHTFNVKNGIDGQDGADGADGVSLGEIALVQTTGASEESVMSQKAISKEVMRLENDEVDFIIESGLQKLPNGYTRVEWIDVQNANLSLSSIGYVTDNNWRFIGNFNYYQINSAINNKWIFVVNTSDNSASYGLRIAANTSSLYIRGGQTNNVIYTPETLLNVWHDFDIYYGKVTIDGTEYSTTHKSSSFSTATYMRLYGYTTYGRYRVGTLKAYYNNILKGYFIPCKNSNNEYGYYDTVNSVWLSHSTVIGGPELLNDTYDKVMTGESLQTMRNWVSQEQGTNTSKLMSQKAITDALRVAELTYNAPTHLGSRLCYLDINTTYSQFDPRGCEGISIVFDGDTKAYSSYTNSAYLWITNGSNVSSSNPLFGIIDSWGTIYAGLIQSMSSNRIYNGCGTSIALANYAHCAMTFRFSTGEFCIYKNGVLLNSSTPSNYDAETVQTVMNSCQYLALYTPTGTTYNQYTTTGMALFGHVLSASEVSTIFGGGCESTKGILLPNDFSAYQIPPKIYTSWSLNSGQASNYTVTNDTENGGKIITMNSGKTSLGLAFVISSGNFSRRCRREFDFTVVSGSVTYTNTQYNGNLYNVLVIKNSNGETVTGALTEGTYHASCFPTQPFSPLSDTIRQVDHYFTTAADTVIRIHQDYKITDMGAGLVCSCSNYRGTYFEQHDGTHTPVSSDLIKYYDVYKSSTVIYNSSNLPQFNGQMAVDTTNGKVYVGYLTGTGGTWKQINNS